MCVSIVSQKGSEKGKFVVLLKLRCFGQKILAECAVRDMIWGIGLSMKDEKRFDMKEWKGQNLPGFSIMKVRDRLKNVKS